MGYLNYEDGKLEIGGYVAIIDTTETERRKMIWGIGQSSDEAYAEAFKNFRNISWELHIYPCSKELVAFVEKYGGEEATKHCFLYVNDDYVDLIPSHDTIEEFCNKHSLSPQAREELFKIASFPINYGWKITDE
jgi:hypothetical protein